MLLNHRSQPAVELQRTALRVLFFNVREDRVGVGEARLAVEQFGQKDEALFPGRRVKVPCETGTLGLFRFPEPFPFGKRARKLAR